jgi:hypothetical protein
MQPNGLMYYAENANAPDDFRHPGRVIRRVAGAVLPVPASMTQPVATTNRVKTSMTSKGRSVHVSLRRDPIAVRTRFMKGVTE